MVIPPVLPNGRLCTSMLRPRASICGNMFRLTKMFSVVDQKINSDSLHNLNFRINQFRTFRCPLPPTPPVCRCLRRSFASHSPAPGTFTALPDRAPSCLHELCGRPPLPP